MSTEEIDHNKIAEEAARRVLELSKSEEKPAATATFSELMADGKEEEAVRMLVSQAKAEAMRDVLPIIAAQAQSARRTFEAEIGPEELQEWMPEIEQQAKKYGIKTEEFITSDQWREALSFAKAKNIAKVQERITEKTRAEMLAEIQSGGFVGGGSFGVPNAETREAMAGLDAKEREAIARMGFDAKSYKASKKVMDDFRDDAGGVTDCPVLDRDIDSVVHRKDYLIEPGRF
jgi:hypothetical protein